MADQDPREYARQQFRSVLSSLGKQPTGPGSGPTDEEYYLNRIMEEGGWDSGYDWAGRIKRGIEGTQPALGTPGFDPSFWGPVHGAQAPQQNRASALPPQTPTPAAMPAPTPELNTQGPYGDFNKGESKAPATHQDVDVNGIVERALQGLLMND